MRNDPYMYGDTQKLMANWQLQADPAKQVPAAQAARLGG